VDEPLNAWFNDPLEQVVMSTEIERTLRLMMGEIGPTYVVEVDEDGDAVACILDHRMVHLTPGLQPQVCIIRFCQLAEDGSPRWANYYDLGREPAQTEAADAFDYVCADCAERFEAWRKGGDALRGEQP
jgi:hypothetical protein